MTQQRPILWNFTGRRKESRRFPFMQCSEPTADEGATLRMRIRFIPRGRPVLSGRDAQPDRSRVRAGVGYQSSEMALRRTEIRKHLRRLRPQEAAELDALDTKIRALRDERDGVLRRAWQRGHVMTVKEVREAAETVERAGVVVCSS